MSVWRYCGIGRTLAPDQVRPDTKTTPALEQSPGIWIFLGVGKVRCCGLRTDLHDPHMPRAAGLDKNLEGTRPLERHFAGHRGLRHLLRGTGVRWKSVPGHFRPRVWPGTGRHWRSSEFQRARFRPRTPSQPGSRRSDLRKATSQPARMHWLKRMRQRPQQWRPSGSGREFYCTRFICFTRQVAGARRVSF
jgi:hypothetical protein